MPNTKEHTLINDASDFVHLRISLCLFWIKHFLFVWLHYVASLLARFLPFGPTCSPQGRAFIYLTRFTEFIGVKPAVTKHDVDAEPPSTHTQKINLLRQKLVKLFDDNLRLCYPTTKFAGQVKILPVKLFDKDIFKGEERSFLIKTNNDTIPDGQKGQKATVLYFHGGGFLCGESTTYVNILTPWLYENNLDCLMVDYGLFPMHTPAEIGVQGRIGYDYLVNDLGVDPKHIVCAGESAGANLALQVVRELVCEGNKAPAGLVLLSPWVDLTLSTNSWKSHGTDVVLTDNLCRLGEKLEIWQDGEESLRYSPLFMDLSHLPPCLVSWGEQERLQDECVQLCQRLRDCGVTVVKDSHSGMFHAFSLFHQYIPEGKMSLDRAAAFIKERVIP
jgi:monoterpene epsilon-lactone hydrolase